LGWGIGSNEGLDAVIPLNDLGFDINLGEVYEGIKFTDSINSAEKQS